MEKRPAPADSEAPAAKRPALSAANVFASLPPMTFERMFFGGVRQQRALKGSVTKSLNKLAADDWAAGAASRPFQLQDLADPAKYGEARRYYDSLSHEQIKFECQSHGVPKTGAKYKLLAALEKHARTARQ